MISFASERGLGQDLATHLLNADQNEYVEIAWVRGAVADDLHGAFAEWEVQAHTLTRCKNYLYSVSINPDPAQGPITRDQYLDYIGRVEKKLGLENQPCAAVFHIKEGREHCHVVWSKIDLEKEKAVHLAFDHDKLMAVTRQFAREHNLLLPDGYDKEKGNGKDQLTLYEKQKERATGITKEERLEDITDAWRHSDSPKAFVHALAEKGYLLASGRRPFVVVDFYGGMAALPKMIDDKAVRTDDIRKFLGDEFAPETLPSVEDARALIADYRKSMEAYFKEEQRGEQLEMLKRKQDERRAELLREEKNLLAVQKEEQSTLLEKQQNDRHSLRARYLETLQVAKQRRKEIPQKGLPGFLGRVTGINLIRKKLQKHEDKKQLSAYLEEKKSLRLEQLSAKDELQRRQEYSRLDINRRIKAMEKVDQRELKTLKETLTRETRIHARGGKAQMPSLNLALTPPGRKAVPHKAKNRHKNKSLEEKFVQARDHKTGDIDMSDDFKRAVQGEGDGSRGDGNTGQPKPVSEPKVQRYRRHRPRGDDKDRER